MQTKRQIRQLLASASVRPNKRLGQHFLIDLNLMRLLLDSAGIKNNDIVLEVGCGTGSMTSELIQRAGFVIAVELDRTLAAVAASTLINADNLELINTDILKSKHTLSPAVVDAIKSARSNYPGRTLLVANLPYNVASPTMLNLTTGPVPVDAMYITVQKEIADRMKAAPGSDNYGILSIFLDAVGDVRILRILKPTVFWPRPRVDSAMVEFVHNPDKSGRLRNMQVFCETVKLFMGHRRKTLTACSRLPKDKFAKTGSKQLNWREIFERCRIDPSKRPEQLSGDDYIALANAVCGTAAQR
jgi:16S rRNA (adenine1518-N6/adenine1519-N6)-dimethyltransferase